MRGGGRVRQYTREGLTVCEDGLTVYKGNQAVYKGNRHDMGGQTVYEKGTDTI